MRREAEWKSCVRIFMGSDTTCHLRARGPTDAGTWCTREQRRKGSHFLWLLMGLPWGLIGHVHTWNTCPSFLPASPLTQRWRPDAHLTEADRRDFRLTAPKSPGENLNTQVPGPLARDAHLIGRDVRRPWCAYKFPTC